ncbi:MAG TPA: hypothetical protein VJT14_13410 [Candidatus Dormibacteraeota bacterium]|nr:hypothetical protein [Candidatus Dormibacteraeota bacterium]
MPIEQGAGNRADGNPWCDGEEDGQAGQRRGVEALEDEEHERQLHHRIGRPREDDTARQPGEGRDAKELGISRARVGRHDYLA